MRYYGYISKKRLPNKNTIMDSLKRFLSAAKDCNYSAAKAMDGGIIRYSKETSNYDFFVDTLEDKIYIWDDGDDFLDVTEDYSQFAVYLTDGLLLDADIKINGYK